MEKVHAVLHFAGVHRCCAWMIVVLLFEEQMIVFLFVFAFLKWSQRDELARAERLEQKTSPSVTTSKSSLGSVPDEERGDTKKKKRRNPIHKARKMLGKKKQSEEGGQMNNG